MMIPIRLTRSNALGSLLGAFVRDWKRPRSFWALPLDADEEDVITLSYAKLVKADWVVSCGDTRGRDQQSVHCYL